MRRYIVSEVKIGVLVCSSMEDMAQGEFMDIVLLLNWNGDEARAKEWRGVCLPCACWSCEEGEQ